jgi:uncharacterized membrane protein YoaK (UPF0700 family)
MKRIRREALLLGLLLLGLAGFVVFTFVRDYFISSQQQTGYSTSLSELRESFNRDRGKVRLLLLLSPT